MRYRDFLTTTVLLSTGYKIDVRYLKVAKVAITVSGTIISVSPTHLHFKGNRMSYYLHYRRIISIRKEVQNVESNM
ncbi:MAG: hypothetical protein ACK40G_13830 [Cytophagaceae bacterium]